MHPFPKMSNTVRKSIRPGMAVRVIQKHHQSSGELTSGIVQEVLTNSANHHRGIKVRLASGIVGRVLHIDAEVNNSNERTTNMGKSRNNRKKGALDAEDSERQPTQFTIADLINVPNEPQDWACGACTFVNSKFLPECEMCGNAKAV